LVFLAKPANFVSSATLRVPGSLGTLTQSPVPSAFSCAVPPSAQKARISTTVPIGPALIAKLYSSPSCIAANRRTQISTLRGHFHHATYHTRGQISSIQIGHHWKSERSKGKSVLPATPTT
jgi:hypothetical protein